MSVISATARGTLAAAAAAAVGHAVDLPPAAGAGLTVVGAAVSVLANSRDASPSALLYRMGCWLGGGGWATWSLTSEAGPWDRPHWLALGVLAAAAGIAYEPLSQRDKQRVETVRERKAMLLRADSRLAQAWERRILRVTNMRVTVEQVTHWPTKCGYDLIVELPGGGATRSRLAQFEEALAGDAKLPNGCEVKVTKGPHRGAALLRIATHNRLEDEVPHPGDYSPRSILDPAALGEYSDGATAAVILREFAALVVGARGSGKTGVLHCLTCAVGLCIDTLVWHIDLNGGGLSQPWLDPWLEGDTDRPAVDWAAADVDTALAMSRVGLTIAKDRKRAYRRLKAQADATLLPVSRNLPEIVIIVDESAESMAPTNRDPRVAELRANLEELQRIGRNEAVNVIFSSLRATSDMISPNVKKQSAVRIGMAVTDEEELSYLFGWGKGVNPDELVAQGCGFLQNDKERPRAFKAYYMKPTRDIRPAALAIARQRTELDALGRKAVQREHGDVYDNRYEWMRISFSEAMAEGAEREETAALQRHVPTAPVQFTVTAGWDTPATGADHPRAIGGPSTPPPVTGGRPRLYLVGGDDRTQRLRAEQIMPISDGVPGPIRRVLDIFDGAGADRLHSEEIATALDCTVTELAEMLRPYGVTTRPNAFERNGQRRRGYDRADLITAAHSDHQEVGEPAEPTGVSAP